MMQVQMAQDWKELLQSEIGQEYFEKIQSFLAQEVGRGKRIYPPTESIFRAFEYTPFEATRVVILGQDPYHGPGQANGLAFSVSPGVKQPPSLKNIFKELERDLGVQMPNHGSLDSWAKQGVLLLNTILTVREGEPASHQDIGWKTFTDKVLNHLWSRKDPVIFLLWGAAAQKSLDHIPANEAGAAHVVLRSAHPSPLSAHRGFIGCGHFREVNQILSSWGQKEIDWSI